MEANTIQELWRRLEGWLRANAPTILESLNPGATEEQISNAESVLSVRLPEDVKAAYRIHNGQDGDEGLIDGKEFLSLERIQEEWRVWKNLLDAGDFDESLGEPKGPIRNDWWNSKWIPITYDGFGNHDCVDLEPAEGGQVGQIISFWHDEATREMMAQSFSNWFEAFVEGCEAGDYAYSEDDGGIVRVEDE